MGQIKYYRYNIKQLLHSLEFKNKYHYFKNINITRYGLCLAEAELLAEIANKYFQTDLLHTPENHFSISLNQHGHSNKKQNLNDLPQKLVTIPAFSHYELEIYQCQGLKALQTYRIIAMLDSLNYQNAGIDINNLAKIVNITPKSIRERLIPLLKLGVRFNITFLSNKWSSPPGLFRYSYAIKSFFIYNTPENQILKNLFISKSEWNFLLFEFFQYTYGNLSLLYLPQQIFEEISFFRNDICETEKYREISTLFPTIETPFKNADNRKNRFIHCLKHLFAFSNALITDYIKFLEQEAANSNNNRRPGEIVFYAVSDKTISGMPLKKTAIHPIKITYWSEDDKVPESPYNTTQRKWNKTVRYTLQAQNQNTNLTQYDLSYLLGVSVAVVKKLMKKNEHFHIPTRGNAHDIGPGVSHAEQIIKLYLEGYTETEIKFKTRHSYSSIENYLLKFTKVVGLSDLGLNLHQIRMAAKTTYNLTKSFHNIYEKYDLPQYLWVLSKIRNNFNGIVKKKLKIKKESI